MSDLISRKVLLEALKGVEVCWYIDGNHTTYDDTTIMDIIEEQPSMEFQTWIPCSEKMPSEHDYPEQKHRVLASCSDGIVRNASIKSMLSGEKRYALGHIEFTYEAWMPLPPAFKGEQHEID